MKTASAVATLLLLATITPAASEEPKTETKVAEASPLDKISCKKLPITGSFARKKKVCKTERQWEHERQLLRDGQGTSDSCRDRANGGGLCEF
jgi:hypothetical protein